MLADCVSEDGMETTERARLLPWPYLRPYFAYVSETENNISVECKLCLPRKKILSAGKTSNSNLRKHIKVRTIGQLWERHGRQLLSAKCDPAATV